MENDPMDEDQVDASRNQTDNQEEIDLFEDGDGTHLSTSRPCQSNDEACDSKFSTGAQRDWRTQYNQGWDFIFRSC